MDHVVLDFGNNPVTLKFKMFEDEINLDELTSIDYSNLYGEAVTISALLSKLGIFRAEAEKHLSQCKLDYEICEAQIRKGHRKFANNNGGKIQLDDGTLIKMTENGLDEVLKTDIFWQKKKKKWIEAKRQYDYIDAIFWSASSKDKKLNNIVKAITPEELYDELIEGAINGIVIQKQQITYGSR